VAISQIVLSVFSHRGAEIREATLVGVTYLENWNMIYGWWPVGYMGATWSLSVEEQFYLLWPLTLVFLANKLPLVWIAYAVLAMTIAELIFWRGGGAGTEHTLQFSLGIRPVGLLIVFVTAALSYEFVEKPILRHKDRLGGTPDHPHAGSSSCQLASNR
jgi:peptidoglycan/LPS O-acetylase OafA/YrhL